MVKGFLWRLRVSVHHVWTLWSELNNQNLTWLMRSVYVGRYCCLWCTIQSDHAAEASPRRKRYTYNALLEHTLASLEDDHQRLLEAGTNIKMDKPSIMSLASLSPHSTGKGRKTPVQRG